LTEVLFDREVDVMIMKFEMWWIFVEIGEIGELYRCGNLRKCGGKI